MIFSVLKFYLDMALVYRANMGADEIPFQLKIAIGGVPQDLLCILKVFFKKKIISVGRPLT